MSKERWRDIPAGCEIKNIRRGKGGREKYVYAELRDRDGNLLIAATLDYITEQVYGSNIVEPESRNGFMDGLAEAGADLQARRTGLLGSIPIPAAGTTESLDSLAEHAADLCRDA